MEKDFIQYLIAGNNQETTIRPLDMFHSILLTTFVSKTERMFLAIILVVIDASSLRKT